MIIASNGSAIIPNYFIGGVAIVFFYPVKPNQTYVLEVTNDAVTYTTAYTFTTGPAAQTYSYTVSDPAGGGPWPRLTQK